MRRLVPRASAAVMIATIVGLSAGWSAPALANRGGGPAPAPETADVSITKTASDPGGVAPGGRIEYTIVVRNAGPAAAEGVSFTDTLPAGTTVIEATSSAPGATCTLPPVDGAITCQLGTMPVGAVAEFVFIVLVDPTTAGGTLLANTAQVTSTTDDPDLANNTAAATTLVRGADLVVSKVASSSVVAPGSPLIYTITITNQGPTDEPAVFLTDQLPANTTVDQVSPAPACVAQTGTVSCQLGPLAAGESVVVTVAVTVSPAAPPGDLINTATVTGADEATDPNPNNNADTATSTILAAFATAGGGDTHLVGQPAGDAPVVLGTELPRTGSRSVEHQTVAALALIVLGLPVRFASRRRARRA